MADLPAGATVHSTIRNAIDPVVRPIGYVREKGTSPGWAQANGASLRTFFWVQLHPDAKDPFSGGEFLVEFERTSTDRPAKKLAGRARFDQLLEQPELERVIRHQNDVIASLPRPPASHVASYPASLQDAYLKEFQPQGKVRPGNLWLRYQTLDHVQGWLSLLSGLLPSILARAARLDPHVLYLGRKIDLDSDPLRPTNPPAG